MHYLLLKKLQEKGLFLKTLNLNLFTTTFTKGQRKTYL